MATLNFEAEGRFIIKANKSAKELCDLLEEHMGAISDQPHPTAGIDQVVSQAMFLRCKISVAERTGGRFRMAFHNRGTVMDEKIMVKVDGKGKFVELTVFPQCLWKENENAAEETIFPAKVVLMEEAA